METEWLKFQAWVNGSMKSGTTFCPDLAGFDMYVPYSSLRAYWKHEKIMQVLHECTGPNDTRNIDQILESFIRIFSTLVYIHSAKGPTVHYITEFMSRNPSPITDNNLWLDPTGTDARRLFGDIDNCPSSRATCDVFCENQYRFNHVLFRPGSGVNLGQLDRKMILPLQFDSSILSGKQGGTSVTVFKVQPGSGLGPEDMKIVVKDYPNNTTAMQYFYNETSSYTALINLRNSLLESKDRDRNIDGRRIDECFLRYFGSFQKDGKGFLLLEYADQKSLLELFDTTSPPWKFDQIYNFWGSLSALLDGLGLLYSHERPEGAGTLRQQIIHQDLKLANIFVLSVPTSEPGSDSEPGSHSECSYIFKIGDLGSSSSRVEVHRLSATSDSAHPVHASTRMYEPPEHSVDDGVTWKGDIWSLGCVLFEAAVWSVGGKAAWEEFFLKRKKETQENDGAFHKNGEELDAIKNMRSVILECRRRNDSLTEGVIDIIVEKMLAIDPDKRKRPKVIGDLLRKHLQNNRSSPTGQSCTPSHTLPSGPSREPSVADGSSHSRPTLWQPPQSVLPQGSTGSINSTIHRGGPQSPESWPPRFDTQSETNSSGILRLPHHDRRPHIQAPTQDRPPLDVNTGTSLASSATGSAREHARGQSTPPTRQTPATRANGTDNIHQNSKVSLNSVVAYWKYKQQKVHLSVHRPVEPPGLETAVTHFKSHRGRKQIFVLDDCLSKRQWDEIKEVFKAFAYFLDRTDDREIDVYFISMLETGKRWSPKKMIGLVDKQKHQDYPPPERRSLESLATIMAKIQRTSLPMTSDSDIPVADIYIMTDRVWQRQGGEDDRRALVEWLRSLESGPGLPRASVRVIWFPGDDQAATAVVEATDDIIDDFPKDMTLRRYSTDDVWHMLL